MVWTILAGSLLLSSCSTMAEKPKSTVCVTGASGFVASVLIDELKQQGYSVSERKCRTMQQECALFDDVALSCRSLVRCEM
jgi:predicted ATPase